MANGLRRLKCGDRETLNDGDVFLWRLWDEAFEHTRHLETLRAQNMGFLFAAILGVSTLSIDGLVAHHASQSATVTVAAVLGAGLSFLAAYLFVAVSRLNQVLGHYQRVAIAIFEAKPLEGELATLNELPPPALIRWHGTEVVLLSVVMSLALALAADFRRPPRGH
jgi:hypothetical protein